MPDELWALVAPLLPAPPRPPYGGWHRTVSDRACLAAIIYMARTSTPGGCCPPASWAAARQRPAGGGSPSGPTPASLMRSNLAVLDRLGEQGRLDWSRASVDTMSVRARRGGTTWAQIPSIVASLEASCIWSATVAGCR